MLLIKLLRIGLVTGPRSAVLARGGRPGTFYFFRIWDIGTSSLDKITANPDSDAYKSL